MLPTMFLMEITLKRQSANRLNKPSVYLPRIHCRDNQEPAKKLWKGERKEPKSTHLPARKQNHLRSKRNLKPFLTKNRIAFVHHESLECTKSELDLLDQFNYLGNRARYEFIELDMSTGLDLSIPSSKPLTFPGGQSKNGYRARWLIQLGFSREEKQRKKWKLKQ